MNDIIDYDHNLMKAIRSYLRKNFDKSNVKTNYKRRVYGESPYKSVYKGFSVSAKNDFCNVFFENWGAEPKVNVDFYFLKEKKQYSTSFEKGSGTFDPLSSTDVTFINDLLKGSVYLGNNALAFIFQSNEQS